MNLTQTIKMAMILEKEKLTKQEIKRVSAILRQPKSYEEHCGFIATARVHAQWEEIKEEISRQETKAEKFDKALPAIMGIAVITLTAIIAFLALQKVPELSPEEALEDKLNDENDYFERFVEAAKSADGVSVTEF